MKTLLFLIVSITIMGSAPFCRVDNYGNAYCFYYTKDACIAAVKAMGGDCYFRGY